MVRSRVAIAQPTFAPGGGTEAVTAWIIEALKMEHQVTLISYSRIGIDQLNRYCGTSLQPGEFSTVRLRLPPGLNRTRRFSILKDHLLMRYCKAAGGDFDLFICPSGVMDFGKPGVQYVGLGPGAALVKVLGRDGSTPNRLLNLKRVFMRACEWWSSYSEGAAKRNTTLAPSRWAGKVIERVFDINDYQVVYPPIDYSPSKVPWGQKTNGFLCVSRIIPEKRIETVIEVLRRVRESGHDVTLRIVGRQDDPKYSQTIRRICSEHSSWLSLDEVLDRSQILPLMASYRYGIHGALDEPFGIAIAEMVNSGCIMFVPNGGGQVEIVDSPELTFNNIDDGVSKINAVMVDDTLRSDLADRLAKRGELFSARSFCEATRRVVDEVITGQTGEAVSGRQTTGLEYEQTLSTRPRREFPTDG